MHTRRRHPNPFSRNREKRKRSIQQKEAQSPKTVPVCDFPGKNPPVVLSLAKRNETSEPFVVKP
jgi:hypothetical protein